jgi:hypothetical protein
VLFEQQKLRCTFNRLPRQQLSNAGQHRNSDGLSARLLEDASTTATAVAAVELDVGCTLRMVPQAVDIVSIVQQQHRDLHGSLTVVCSAISNVYKITHVEAYVRAEMRRCLVCS